MPSPGPAGVLILVCRRIYVQYFFFRLAGLKPTTPARARRGFRPAWAARWHAGCNDARTRRGLRAAWAAGWHDRGAGLEFRVDEKGAFQFIGVPPERGFRHRLEDELNRRGVRLAVGG